MRYARLDVSFSKSFEGMSGSLGRFLWYDRQRDVVVVMRTEVDVVSACKVFFPTIRSQSECCCSPFFVKFTDPERLYG